MSNPPVVPVLKLLTESGAGSRRRMADAIKQGRVTVNGEVIEDFRHPVNPVTDRVQVDGRGVTRRQSAPVYLMVNKPAGILTTTADEQGRRTVLDILPPQYRALRLFPVGRLDKDTTGLLILTNDGDMTHRLTHPSFEHEKEYLVRIGEKLAAEEKRRLENGIRLEEGMTSRAVIREVRGAPAHTYSLTLHEGRKRQVRRMFARLGHSVTELKRVRTGNLRLGTLDEGKVRALTTREVASLLER